MVTFASISRVVLSLAISDPLFVSLKRRLLDVVSGGCGGCGVLPYLLLLLLLSPYIHSLDVFPLSVDFFSDLGSGAAQILSARK